MFLKTTAMPRKSKASAPPLAGRVAAITGGAGALGGAMAEALARAGASVAIIGRNPGKAAAQANKIRAAGGQALGLDADVTDRAALEAAAQKIRRRFHRLDYLINAAGGNSPEATTSDHQSFFALDAEAVRRVFELNFLGTFLACQVLGQLILETAGRGQIVNISSMAAFRPLTRVAAYSAAKAAVSNFTQWLAVHLAQNYTPELRVNAIAPGFFLTEQNRFLLTDPRTQKLTPRGQTILAHTPAGRFGGPDDLAGTLLWLLDPRNSFVNGAVVPVDGGFSAFSGV